MGINFIIGHLLMNVLNIIKGFLLPDITSLLC